MTTFVVQFNYAMAEAEGPFFAQEINSTLYQEQNFPLQLNIAQVEGKTFYNTKYKIPLFKPGNSFISDNHPFDLNLFLHSPWAHRDLHYVLNIYIFPFHYFWWGNDNR